MGPEDAPLCRRLSLAERNDDIGNRELLVLEEWRHWLEGTKQLFHVWMDHKNLEYLRLAKRLNPHQAWLALFFTWVNFTLSYRPGSKGVKPDSPSRQSRSDQDNHSHKPMLPPTCLVGSIAWEIEAIVHNAQRHNAPILFLDTPQ